MKKIVLMGVTVLLSLIFFVYISNYNFSKASENQKSRILYYEGGSYYDHKNNLISLFQGLSKIGIIEPIDFSDFLADVNSDDSKEIWNYICDNLKSEIIEVHKEDFYSSHWNELLRVDNIQIVLNRLNKDNNNIDLVIAMGNWAGLDLCNDWHKVNTMVLSSSNPIQAGIINKNNHVFVEYTPHIFYQQINLFHSIFQFKKLGIVFTDTPEGRSHISYDDIIKISKQKNFEVIECKVDEYEQDEEKLISDSKKCIDELANKCDAMYFGEQNFMLYEYIPYIVSATIKNKIPTWSHHGTEHVRRGILMSTSDIDQFKRKGEWQALVLNDIINGTSPYKIDNIWNGNAELSINLEVAKRIEFTIPISLLKISKEVFNKIETGWFMVEKGIHNDQFAN